MVMWLFHVLAIFLLDRVGRRPLLLVGVAGQIIGLAILGAAFQFQQLASFKSYVAIGGLVIYVACFAFGLGPIFWLLISEIYPLKIRGAAMSAVTVTNWALNLVVAVTFLTLVGVLGHAGTFWLYGVIVAIGAWVFFICWCQKPKVKRWNKLKSTGGSDHQSAANFLIDWLEKQIDFSLITASDIAWFMGCIIQVPKSSLLNCWMNFIALLLMIRIIYLLKLN